MTMTRKTRRAVLLGVALLLVAGNVWWFSREEPSAQQAFELTPTFGGDFSLKKQVTPLAFDDATSTWKARGGSVADLQPYVERQLMSLSLDGAEPEPMQAPASLRDEGLAYLPVRDDPQRTAEGMRRLILSLLQAGICQVGVVDEARPGSAHVRVELYGIIAVRDDAGRRLVCTAS